jgi:hypothetical protein
MEAALALLLLAPQVPLLFMGEEWGETPTRSSISATSMTSLPMRCARAAATSSAASSASARPRPAPPFPIPTRVPTFEASKLDWSKLEVPAHARRLELVKDLLALRARVIVPRLPAVRGSAEAAGSLLRRAGRSATAHSLPSSPISAPPSRTAPARFPTPSCGPSRPSAISSRPCRRGRSCGRWRRPSDEPRPRHHRGGLRHRLPPTSRPTAGTRRFPRPPSAVPRASGCRSGRPEPSRSGSQRRSMPRPEPVEPASCRRSCAAAGAGASPASSTA